MVLSAALSAQNRGYPEAWATKIKAEYPSTNFGQLQHQGRARNRILFNLFADESFENFDGRPFDEFRSGSLAGKGGKFNVSKGDKDV